MLVQHLYGVLSSPKNEWQSIQQRHYTASKCLWKYVVFLAAIPALSAYIGATQFGFYLSDSIQIKLTTASALPIGFAIYFAMIAGLYMMAWFIRWMQPTYGSTASWDDCMVLATFTAAPLFLAGLAALIPILWIDIIIGMLAVSYSVYLLYSGVPVIMKVNFEQGFLFSSAIVTIALVVLVGMLGTTVFLWGTILDPVFNSGAHLR